MMNGKWMGVVLMAGLFAGGCAGTGKMSGEDCGCDVDEANERAHKDVEDGISVDQAALPAAVLAGFQKAYPGVTIKEIEKELDAGETHYEITYTDAAGEHEVELNEKGEVAHGDVAH